MFAHGGWLVLSSGHITIFAHAFFFSVSSLCIFRYLLCAFFRIIYTVDSLNCDFFFNEITEKSPAIKTEWALFFIP